MQLSEAIKMYQYCYFILTVWGYAAMLLLPGRFVYIFEFISETLKSKKSVQNELNFPSTGLT